MLLFKTNKRNITFLEWFDFKFLIIVKVIFLLWGLAILGIFLRMFEITRGFKILLPIAIIVFISSFFPKNKVSRHRGFALSIFVFALFLIVKVIDISNGTKYFSGINL